MSETQPDAADTQPEPTAEEKRRTKAINALKFRAIGPAVMGGRLSDIAIHPDQPYTWYIAAGSGNIWKTENAGTTWKPIFDDQGSYSIGCIAQAPSNPNHVWVGTGENVSGRHVGYGDGVYKSLNGGQTWQKMGLAESEHIGHILIDPRDANTILVAAEGPLWSGGGERGVYRSDNGGESWTQTLAIDEHTGVTDIKFDPTNPAIVYAAAYQRRRSVAGFMGGGPNSGIYKSEDNGQTWRKITAGLPKGDMGKIGLAVTPANPNLVYATIEAGEKEKGFYRSEDKGESWEKRHEYISGGTGPHYYQRLFASPTNPDLVYQMDVFIHVTRDGGKTITRLEDAKGKHSDNHAMWLNPTNENHMLIGCDAGLYESFDGGMTWRHFPNLPISQFYRVALDNSEPFFNILGGAQDLGTLFGPSRTMNAEGVRNQDWYVPLGADGYHAAFDPEDPDTFYLEFQVGNLFRYDRRSEELLHIKPLPEPNEPPERWNWDAPLIISPHDPHRLYFASQRVWRSDDRGNSWVTVSDDLTRNENRYELEIMGRVWSVDDLYDQGAMSQYNTITTLSESPLVAGLLFAGTDDGLIQVSENGGESWHTAVSLPQPHGRAFIQCVRASQHDPDTLFAIADAHKFGDFAPYLFVSQDRGQSWQAISGDLPQNMILWAVEQDHINPNLLFLAGEFGLFVSLNSGENWHKLGGNVPTIAFRDLKLQRRDNDLVGASFGRGFYVLDDYSPLRDIADGVLEQEDEPGYLFPMRDAWWYIPHTPMQSAGQPTLGQTAFVGPNPPFGATFTYSLREDLLSAKQARQKAEKEQREADENASIPFPGWEQLQQEVTDIEPQILLLVRNEAGETVRRVKGSSTEAGLHRVSWDLRLSPPDPIQLKPPTFRFPWQSEPQGALVAPGVYSVQLYIASEEGLEAVGEPRSFRLKPVRDEHNFAVGTAFQAESNELLRRVHGAEKEVRRTKGRLLHCQAALAQTPGAEGALFETTAVLMKKLAQLDAQLTGDKARGKLNEASQPSVRERVGWIVWGQGETRQPPTATQRRSLEIATAVFTTLLTELTTLIEQDVAQLEKALADAGAPWTPGRRLG